MPEQILTETQPKTLDQVFNAMKHWRKNKREYEQPGIPDSVWTSIFELENSGYSKNELRQLFSLNSQQYDKKRYQLFSTQTVQRAESSKPIESSGLSQNEIGSPFAEVFVADDLKQTEVPPLTSAAYKTKQVIKQLKSTDNKPEQYLDNATVVVECIRGDGHRLKIHLTTCRLDTLIQGFLNYGDIQA